MDSLEFRSQLLVKLRKFEGWAWKDSTENPDDYQNMGYVEWLELFKDYLENETVN